MAWKYAASIDAPHGKAVGRGLPISSKHAIEISKHLRGKSLKRAKAILHDMLKKQYAIPFKTFNRDVGHKPGIAGGRYPIKAGSEVLTLIESAENNANAKGLSVPDLYVAHICAQRGQRSWRGGRKGRVKSKSTHVEVILAEGLAKEKKKISKKTKEKTTAQKTVKKEGSKTEKAPKAAEEPVKTQSKSTADVQQKTEEKKEQETKEETKAKAPATENVEAKKEKEPEETKQEATSP